MTSDDVTLEKALKTGSIVTDDYLYFEILYVVMLSNKDGYKFHGNQKQI